MAGEFDQRARNVAPRRSRSRGNSLREQPAGVRPVSPTPLRSMSTRTSPAISSSYSPASGGGYGGGSGGGSYGGGAASFSAPAPVSDEDWLGGDSSYQAQLAALIRAASDYDTDVTAQKSKYDVDYNDAVKNLGFVQDDPSTAEVDESKWNFGDLNTAAGRSFQNQRNDFAGRGMLQSSLYGTANDNLTRSLNDQLGGVNTAKQSFFDDISRQQGSFKNDNTLSRQQARAEALARRAATIA